VKNTTGADGAVARKGPAKGPPITAAHKKSCGAIPRGLGHRGRARLEIRIIGTRRAPRARTIRRSFLIQVVPTPIDRRTRMRVLTRLAF